MSCGFDSLVIAPLTIDDCAPLDALDRRCFTGNEVWDEGSFLKELEHGYAHVLVLRIGERVAGCGGFWEFFGSAEITTICIDPDFRGRGLGKLLFGSLTKEMIALGVASSTLEVRFDNGPAIKLYDAFGYRQVSLRRDYYGRGCHAKLMQASGMDLPEYKQKVEDILKPLYV